MIFFPDIIRIHRQLKRDEEGQPSWHYITLNSIKKIYLKYNKVKFN